MRRKAKQPKPPPRVWRELERQVSDQVQLVQLKQTVPAGAIPVSRLGSYWQRFPLDTDAVAASINSCRGGVVFCDSTVFLAPTDDRIWAALLRDHRIALIRPILDELRWWLADCKGVNAAAHKQICAHLNGDTSAPIRSIGAPPTDDLRRALIYYVNLIGIRKQMLAIARQKFEKENGRQPTQQEVSNYCQQAGTPRAQLLGRQGADPKIPAHLYNDEWLVVSALVYAISTGREVTILSSDEAVLDQFCKLTCLLTWHFVAMGIAGRYAIDPLGMTTRRELNPDPTAFAGDEVLLIQKPSALPFDLLPSPGRSVMAHCMLLHEDVTRVSMNLDQGMRQLLDIKGRTGGLTTARLNGKNCHLFLTGTAGLKVGDFAVIAEDVAAPIPGTDIKLASVDLEHALLSDETVIPTRWVDPRLIIA